MIDGQFSIVDLMNKLGFVPISNNDRYKASMDEKAIGLVRVSTKVQDLEQQSEAVKKEILKDGFQEDNIILIENQESASKLSEEERQGLRQMKWYIEHDSSIKVVYCYEISRISRKEHILYSIREYLCNHHVQLICLVPYFKMFNDDWSISNQAAFTFSIFSTLAQQETQIRNARISRGKEIKRNQCKLAQGYPIFGYTVDKDHYIIPHPKQAPIVREIFQRYANLESSGSIGKDLWLRGLLCCKTDKLINHQTRVCGILRERRYAFADDIYRCPIISKELWNKVCEIHSNKPQYFTRKSRTKGCYPLQGMIYTEDGYCLTPSITNFRYLKMNGSTKPLSLNMKAADSLALMVMNKYLKSVNNYLNREQEREELTEQRDIITVKLSEIESKIDVIKEERNRINRLYVKGRISESESDNMMNANKNEINALEDIRQDLTYNLSVINNKLILAANPLLLEENPAQIETKEDLKEAIHKYIKKIVAVKLGFSRYELSFQFLDGQIIKGRYFSTNKKLELEIV